MLRSLIAYVRGALLLAAIAWLVAVGALWACQDRFLFPAAYRAPEPAPAAALKAAGFTPREIATSDGLRLGFWAAAPRAGMPVILFFHGNNIFAPDHLGDMAGFAAAGYGVVLAEFRGYDGDPGHPSEAALIGDATAYADWTAKNWPDAKLVIWGESIGTGVAVGLAAAHPASALILDAPFTSVRALAEQHYPWAPVGLLLRSPLVMQGEDDPIIPVSHGHRMLAAASCPVAGVFLPGVRHPAFINDHIGVARQAVIDFLNRLRAGTLVCGAARASGD
jgi:fermentation-respiration switch protein FrsA (DUF1100 family)